MSKTNRYKDLSILLVEDDVDSRLHIVEILENLFSFVHVASDGCEGLDVIEQYHPNIIISDIEMPCMSGVDMLHEAKKTDPNAIYIFSTAFNTTRYLHNAIDLQIDGYLVKPIHIDKLFEKIDTALSKRVSNHSVSENNVKMRTSSLLHKELSKREYEVFLDITRGIKPNSIAQKYNIKSKTVSTYRTRIMEKMGINTNAELIRYAIINELL